MANDTYHNTVLKTLKEDGAPVTLQAGQGVRLGTYLFADAVILGFMAPDKHGNVNVKLARPMANAICIGTTGPGTALQVEEFSCSITQLLNDPKVVFYPVRDEGCRVLQGAGPSIDRPYSSEAIDLVGPV